MYGHKTLPKAVWRHLEITPKNTSQSHPKLNMLYMPTHLSRFPPPHKILSLDETLPRLSPGMPWPAATYERLAEALTSSRDDFSVVTNNCV